MLRRDDILAAALRVDEAIVRGRVKGTKTEESAAVMYLPPDLELEVKHYLGALSDDSPKGWLFPSSRKEVALSPGNFLKRVLKPAAIRAKIAISKNSEGKEVTGCNFQSLRPTSGTLFGDPCGGSCCVAGIRDGFPRRKEEPGSGAGNRH